MSNDSLDAQQVEELPQVDLAQFLACETPNLSADSPVSGERVA